MEARLELNYLAPHSPRTNHIPQARQERRVGRQELEKLSAALRAEGEYVYATTAQRSPNENPSTMHVVSAPDDITSPSLGMKSCGVNKLAVENKRNRGIHSRSKG